MNWKIKIQIKVKLNLKYELPLICCLQKLYKLK